MSRHWIPNPRGLGGFRLRPQDRFVIGAPGSPICGAKTKRGRGEPCRDAPIDGGRCRHHGGLSRGPTRPALPKNSRQAHSKAVATVRKAARAELAATQLHPETMKVYARYAGEIYRPNEAVLILAIDQHLRAEIDAIEFRAALALARERR
jgi:hypothetical protein